MIDALLEFLDAPYAVGSVLIFVGLFMVISTAAMLYGLAWSVPGVLFGIGMGIGAACPLAYGIISIRDGYQQRSRSHQRAE